MKIGEFSQDYFHNKFKILYKIHQYNKPRRMNLMENLISLMNFYGAF